MGLKSYLLIHQPAHIGRGWGHSGFMEIRVSLNISFHNDSRYLIPRMSRLWFIQNCPSPLYQNHPLTLSHTQFINYFQHSFPPFKPHFVLISLLAFAFKFCITRFMGVAIYLVFSSFGQMALLWKKEKKQILKLELYTILFPTLITYSIKPILQFYLNYSLKVKYNKSIWSLYH